METIPEGRAPDHAANHGGIMIGMIAIIAGVLLLVERLDLAEIHITSRLWPLFPLALGLLRIIDPPQSREPRRPARHSGAWLVFIGCWGLVNEFHVWDLDYGTSWPLVVVFAGAAIVWRAVDPSVSRRTDERRGV